MFLFIMWIFLFKKNHLVQNRMGVQYKIINRFKSKKVNIVGFKDES